MLNSRAMRIPPVDLPYLREQLRDIAAQLREAWDSSSHARDEVDTPGLLRDAMAQLLDMLGHIHAASPEANPSAAEINTLGEYGLHLLDEMSQLAADLEQPSLARDVERLCLPFALWIARHGGEIRSLAPVVNALAHFANNISQPQQLAELYGYCCELIEATSPVCHEQLSGDTRQPWRLLLLNRAIVATRSHNTALIECAYDAIVEYLPHEAQRFFSEGMEQMAAIDYPQHVQNLVRRYFLAYAKPKSLH